ILIVCPIAELDAAETENFALPLLKDWYVSVFLMRSYPIGGTLIFDGDKIPDTTFGSTTGGGLKIGAFSSNNSVWGVEFEVSGHRGTIRAPQTVVGNTVRSAQIDTTVINLMLNALARYPGDYIQPYTGVGVGFSVLQTDGHTQSSSGIRETGSLFGGTVQGIIGVRLMITDDLFGFTEYKPTLFGGCSDKYVYIRKSSCTLGPIHRLDSQSHYVTAGIGYWF
ncbi:MAG: outer membrane beta-barrel protein, partial [Nitrospira sp.]